MATKQLTGAPMRADHHRPTPLSVFRPTAPLPQPAVEALARLERAFAPVQRIVTASKAVAA